MALENKQLKSAIEQMKPQEVMQKMISETTESGEDMSFKDKVMRAFYLEDLVSNYIKREYGNRYDYERNVRIGRHEYDLIVVDKKNNKDLIYEIKSLSNRLSITAIEKILKNLNNNGLAYKENATRNFRLCLFIVTKAELVGKMNDDFWKLSKDLFGNIDINIMDENELEEKMRLAD